MKRILSIAVLLLFASMAMGADIKFDWDYGTPRPSGFELRASVVQGGPTVQTKDCGVAADNTCLMTLVAGTYYVTGFAYNIGVPATLKIYSGSSNVVNIVIPVQPAPLTNMIAGPGETAMLYFEVPKDQVATVTLTFDRKQ